jgi:excisionase family DNA binding protein
MTIDQVAAYLQLNKQVVYRHVRKGNIPVSRIGATLRFKKSIIDRWLTDSALRSLRSGPQGTGGGAIPTAQPSSFDLSVD